MLIYADYIQSADWRMRRNRRLRIAGWRCERCGDGRALEVHHLTYARLGREWDQDLEVLCGDCHHGEHLRQLEQSPDGSVMLRIVRIAWRDRAALDADIGDIAEAAKRLCAAYRIPYAAPALHRAIHLVTQDDRPIPTRPAPARRPAPASRSLTRQEADDLLAALPTVPTTRRVVAIKTMPSVFVPPDPDDVADAIQAARERAWEMGIEL